MTFGIQPKELKFNVGRNFPMIPIYFCVKWHLKIQMLQFNGVFYRENDEVGLEIIIRDNKRKEKWLP